VAALLLGAVIALAIGELRPSELPMQPLTVFLAGAVAICAMILPGISGSFILVLLGMYGHILTAIKEFDLVVIASFGAGCATGLLSFSHLLSWLLTRFHDTAMTLLTGFLLGSLSLVWPWKQTLSYYQNSRGEQMALEQVNILPGTFASEAGTDSQAFLCFILMGLAVFLVLVLEKIGQINDARKQ
jgi:putative membrane protein